MSGISAKFNAELVTALPRLRRFALTLTRNGPDADDLVQMTCEKAIANIAKRAPDQPVIPWLYTMARNLWISEARKTKVRVGQGQVPAEEVAELVTGASGEENIRANQVLSAVMALPENMASVILLVAVEGHSYAQAAAILDIPQGTVMSRLSTARARLRTTLQQGAA